jgi:CRISPR-associated protein Cas2
VQNSVFEGEMTRSELFTVEKVITEIIDKKQDSVRMYILRSDKYLEQKELGTSHVDISEII